MTNQSRARRRARARWLQARPSRGIFFEARSARGEVKTAKGGREIFLRTGWGGEWRRCDTKSKYKREDGQTRTTNRQQRRFEIRAAGKLASASATASNKPCVHFYSYGENRSRCIIYKEHQNAPSGGEGGREGFAAARNERSILKGWACATSEAFGVGQTLFRSRLWQLPDQHSLRRFFWRR